MGDKTTVGEEIPGWRGLTSGEEGFDDELVGGFGGSDGALFERSKVELGVDGVAVFDVRS